MNLIIIISVQNLFCRLDSAFTRKHQHLSMAYLLEIPGSRISILLLLPLFFAGNFLHLCSSGGLIRLNCSENDSYSSDSVYKFNLDNLLGEMRSSSSKTGFYEHKEGLKQTVYGSYLCLGNLPDQNCSSCVYNASDDVIKSCPNQVQAKIWYDECTLQYSGEPFFGELVDDYITWCDSDRFPTSNADRLDVALNETLTKVASRAAGEPRRFATMEVNLTFDHSLTMYTLAQCMPDLSSDVCLQCLNQIVTDQPVNLGSSIRYWCRGRRGGKTVSSSCVLRYQMYRFYAADVPASAPTPPPTLAPAPPPTLDVPYVSVNDGFVAAEHVKRVRRRSHIPEIVGIPTFAVILLIFGTWCYVRTRKTLLHDFEGLDMEEIRTVESLQMDFNKVRAATQNFAPDKKLGEGGFGDVYKGTLENGQEIAVKRLTADSGQGAAEFTNEVLLVAKLQHRNLVKLLGFCLSGKEKILVYEFLPNSSLDKVLFDPTKRAALDWKTRFNIICGIAKGLLYLHQDSRLRIIHRDLKSSNILLDQVMNPKISDFGIAKMLALDQTRASTETLAGTYGYMAPEYMIIGQYSLKSDIYSFGIIVLEIVTGQRNRFYSRPLLEEALLHRAWRLWSENAIEEMVDSTLNGVYSIEEVVKCIHIGLLCIQLEAGRRPTMASVVAALSETSVDLPPPTPPNFLDTSCSSSSVTTTTTATDGTQSSLPPR